MKMRRIKMNMCPGGMVTRIEPRTFWWQRNRIYVPWCNASGDLPFLCFSERNSLYKVWKVRIWAFSEPFVYYPYFVRLLYHKQLKNSPIISLLIYSDICFSLKKSLTWTSGISMVCVIDKMTILGNTNVRCSICE